MTKNKFNLLAFLYSIVLSLLFFYSFTQVDLNLTINKNNQLQSFQKFFQNIGYFQRPISAIIYISVIFLLFIFYFLIIYLISKNKITNREIWKLIILSIIILVFSYPAFSYDLFNYIFYGKIITHYGLNPYKVRALDFPNDTWTRFMHWTQNTYPYGPVWLGISIPFSFLGFQKFIPTLLLYKIIMASSLLGSLYFFQKICTILKNKNASLSLAIFAFNPLILIESLVSAHNDMPMIFLAILAVYLLLKNKFLPSLILILLSAGIKFFTAALIPLWLIYLFFKIKKQELNLKLTAIYLFVFPLLAFIYVVSVREILPWYLIWIFPFVLTLDFKYTNIVLIAFSLGLLGKYLPFIYFGHWNPPVPQIQSWIMLTCLLLGLLSSVILLIRNKIILKN